MAVEPQVQVQPQTQTTEHPKRHKFSVREYERLAEVGILLEDSRLELLEGEIIEMTPIGTHHASCIDTLDDLLHQLAGKNAIVRVQSAIKLTEFSAPQPDVCLMRYYDHRYKEIHPTPADIFLVIEVSDSTLSYDRHIKLPYYALAGIPEVWIVDLNAEMIEQYTKPENAAYSEVKKLGRGASITSTLLPSVTFKVDAVL